MKNYPRCQRERNIASTRAAASRVISGTTWPYVSTVTLICECPRISLTTRGGPFWASRRPAHVRIGAEVGVGSGTLESTIPPGPPSGCAIAHAP